MRLVRVIRQRLRCLFRHSHVENELQREFALHLEQLTIEYRATGMSERDAINAARRAFGAFAITAEQCRDSRRVRFLEDIGKDLAYASRMLAKSPGFTATAVLSLALGVGANTAIFALVKQVILDLLPIRDPNQIVAITRTSIQLPEPDASFSNPFLRDLQSSANLPFDGFLGFDRWDQIAMLAESVAEPVSTEFVTGNYFELLGVHATLGRQFTTTDETADAQPVVVLSHNFWQRRFGADPSVLNRTIHLNNQPFTVIGVSARGFDGLDPGHSPDLRVTIGMAPTLVQFPGPATLSNRGSRWIRIFGRLKPGVSANQAAQSLMPLLLQDHDLDPGRARRSEYRAKVLASERLHVTTAAQGTGEQRHTYETAIWALGLMVAAVLLLACVNIAHLLLARASARAHEFCIRLAIGASRFRLVRQLLTESLLLGVVGGSVGLLIAFGLGRILISLVVSERGYSTLDVAPDTAMLAYNFAVALAASIGFGLAPALQSSRSVLAPGLKGAHSSHVRRLMGRKIMISVQVAISLVLLAGAGLFIRSLNNLRGIDVGFRTDMLLQVTLNPSNYAPERLPDFYNRVVQQVRSLPGVQAVTFGRQRMISNAAWKSGIVVPGFTSPEGDNGPSRDVIGSNYFSALGIPLITGREFTDADTASAPKVAIVNQAFAQFYFGNQNPLGMRIGPGGGNAEYTVVAVTRNAKYREMREATTRFWYVPFAQLGGDANSFRALTLFVRTSSDPISVANSIRAAVGRVDKTIALFDIKTVDAQIGDNIRLERALATLSIFFGMVAALLAGAGLFGVLSYSVAQRRREIGIRIAVGARPAQAAWTIVRSVALFVFLGVAAGIAVTLSLSSLVQRLLFGIQPNDPLTLSSAVVAIWAIAMLGVLIPASQAAKVEPASALRSD
jgi:predicted permease